MKGGYDHSWDCIKIKFWQCLFKTYGASVASGGGDEIEAPWTVSNSAINFMN